MDFEGRGRLLAGLVARALESKPVCLALARMRRRSTSALKTVKPPLQHLEASA